MWWDANRIEIAGFFIITVYTQDQFADLLSLCSLHYVMFVVRHLIFSDGTMVDVDRGLCDVELLARIGGVLKFTSKADFEHTGRCVCQMLGNLTLLNLACDREGRLRLRNRKATAYREHALTPYHSAHFQGIVGRERGNARGELIGRGKHQRFGWWFQPAGCFPELQGRTG